LSEVFADAVAAFHRPRAVRPATRHGQHLPVAVGAGAKPTLIQDLLTIVDDLDGG
jgi:hypothetical protein